MPANKKQRALEAVVSQFDAIDDETLASALLRLDNTAADAMRRWTSAEDCSKVDLVVTQLLQQGKPDAALQYVCKMRDTLAAVSKSIRRLHSLPDGYHTPDRAPKHKSKEEAGIDKAALEGKLQQQLQSQFQLPQGYKALSPMQQESLAVRVTALKDGARLLEKELAQLQQRHVAMENDYIACRIERDDLHAQLDAVKRDLKVSHEHVARIRGVTDTTGLDVFSANSRVKEQAESIAALRGEVEAWKKHAGSYLRQAETAEATCASLAATNRQLRFAVSAQAEEQAVNGGMARCKSNRHGGAGDAAPAQAEVDALRAELAETKHCLANEKRAAAARSRAEWKRRKSGQL